MSTVKLLKELVEPVIEKCECELFDLEFVKEGANWILRIYVDKEGGITINDCENLSRAAEKVLDEADPIKQAYILEVSSPGADRPLRNESDYAKYSGREVDIGLYKAINGSKVFSGELIGLDGGIVSISDGKGGRLSFNRKEIASCRLAVKI